MSGYKITYFKHVRGRGEPIRLLLSIAGVPHEQENIEWTDEVWNARKSEFPVEQLPVLTTEDGMLNQASAIMRYLGKKHGFSGETLWDEATNDAMIGNMDDLIWDVARQVYWWMLWGHEEKPADAESRMQKSREKMMKLVKAAEKLSKTKGGRFINGDEIQICDISCYTAIEFVNKAFSDSFELNEWVENFVKNFTEDERVKKYLAERPETDRV